MTAASVLRPSETGSIRFGETDITYQIHRSSRRKKTVEITLDPTEGVLVAAPADTPSERIQQIVRKRAGWIIRTADARALTPDRKQFISGESIPYLGRRVRLYVEPTDAKRVTVRFHHWMFQVFAPGDLAGEKKREAIRKAIIVWYKRRAAERLASRVQRWAPLVGRQPAAVLVRDQRQRWGSCTPSGSLRFNWRVVQLEPSLIDYIVVHELMHLAIRLHSPEFWHNVARVMPDYRLRRQRLKEAGDAITL